MVAFQTYFVRFAKYPVGRLTRMAPRMPRRERNRCEIHARGRKSDTRFGNSIPSGRNSAAAR